MKTIEKISEGAGYTAVSVGPLDELGRHTFVISPQVEVPGKVFVGSAVGATGAELSFQLFEPGGGTPFLHTHKTHEELYIFTNGTGQFQVDGQVFPIAQGSIVRVAPSSKRTVRNTGSGPLTMICLQCKADSLDTMSILDGVIVDEPVVW